MKNQKISTAKKDLLKYQSEIKSNNNFKGTTGNYEVFKESNGIFVKSGIGSKNGAMALFYEFNGLVQNTEEAIENAKLLANAGNTIQKCGLLPSELLKQRDELLGALKSTKRINLHLYEENTIGNDVYKIIEKALESITKTA